MSLDSVYSEILDKTQHGKKCPAHDDAHGSLSASLAEGKILLKCHAGCEFKTIVAALGLKPTDLFADSGRQLRQRETARYRYVDENGNHLFDVVRLEPPKTFRQQATNGEWSTKKVKKVPFQLPRLLLAVETGKQVLLVEGEKDALRAEEMDFTATTTPGGAGKWNKHYTRFFQNADVVLIPDLDVPGIKGAYKIAAALKDTTKRLRWLMLPDLGEITENRGKDFSDWCNLPGSNADLLQRMIDKAPDWEENEGTSFEKSIPRWLSQNDRGHFSILPAIAAECFVEKSEASLLYHQSSWWEWDSKIWREVEEISIKAKIREVLSQNSISLKLTKSNIINDVHEQIRLMLATGDEFKGFDTEMNKIIFLNGTLNREKAEFQEGHRREDYMTIMLEIEFDPNARCPRWMRFLEEVGLDPDTQETLQMWCGYLLIPTAKLQKCLFLIGEGSNGKGVFLMTLQNMLGPKNCSSLEMAELFDRFKVARLRGKLVNISSDVETSKVLDARFKKLAAGEPQVAEQKFRNAFEFRPYARLLFSANEFIPTRDRSHGFFRRFDLVKFDRTFSEDERDPDLEEKLREELSGIFNWCLVGLKQLENNNWRMTLSEKMKQVHEEFREAVNPVVTFAQERLEFLNNEKIDAETLRKIYYEWCDSHGYHALSAVALGRELKRLYPEIVRKRIMVSNRRIVHYTGVTLN